MGAAQAGGGRRQLLSIPRDLWVTLPNGTTGRINTAHFFAEAEETGPADEIRAPRKSRP